MIHFFFFYCFNYDVPWLSGFGNEICYCVSYYVMQKWAGVSHHWGNWTLEETLLFEGPATLTERAACVEIC